MIIIGRTVNLIPRAPSPLFFCRITIGRHIACKFLHSLVVQPSVVLFDHIGQPVYLLFPKLLESGRGVFDSWLFLLLNVNVDGWFALHFF